MRKRYLLFAGLLSLAIPAFAQYDGPQIDPSRDAKVIFTQDFEADWETWQNTPIGVIDKLEYYIHDGSSNSASFTPWTEREKWQRGLFRTDSVITLYNGVRPTDNEDEIAAGNFKDDKFGTKKDIDNQDRIDAMRIFGEADLGGDYILEYASDTCTVSNAQTYPGGYTANYRRNLFVRGLDIEDNTSYRLTFYVKANRTKINSNNSPRMSAGVFRGYYKSEKPFSMGVESDAANYKYNTSFEYTKSDFSGQWEKVTYMTYYLNDSIANDFVFKDGYWWADDHSWTWAADAEGNTSGYDLNYIVQPDQFFVRLGFLSDFTTFQLDNLSLTKSTIAGAEYDQDKMRIDFGYKTNLADLAKAAKAKTKIPAAEVTVDVPPENQAELGYEWRFEVWGQDKETDEWEEILIRSAEYHDDGYMYLFTEYYDDPLSGDLVPFKFGDYKKVLVTFHNPVDQPDLTLKYSGDGSNLANAFPNALDTAWIKNGKIVPDFYNEIATPNPYVFAGVHSLADLPPVLQQPPFEDGSFGLTPQQSFSFKYSREVWIENFTDGDDLRNTDKAVVEVNGKPWKVSFDKETNYLTITCPDDSWQTMNGDYEIRIIQIKSKGATEYAENVTLHYHFGDFSTVIVEQDPVAYYNSNWRSEQNSYDTNTGTIPPSTYIHDMSTSFKKGDGTRMGASSRLYVLDYGTQDDVDLDNCGYYLANRTSGEGTGNLYTIVNFNKGGMYSIKFKATRWNSSTVPSTAFYVYAKPSGTLEDGNDKGFKTLENVENKNLLGNFGPGTQVTYSNVQNVSTGKWPDGVETFEFKFSVPSSGDYVFEWVVSSGNTNGVLLGNFFVSYLGEANLSTSYVAKLNEAVASAEAKLTDADAPKYRGVMYDELTQVKDDAKAYKGHYPTAYDSVVALVNATVKAMQARMDTVDIYYTAEDKAKAKVTSLENQEGFKTMPTLAALAQLIADNASYDCTTKTGQEIVDAAKVYDDAVKAVDDRVAAINNFNSLLESIVALKDAADAQTGLDEYAIMVNAYNTYKDTPIYTAEDEDFNTAYNGLIDGKNAYVFKVDYIIAKTRQVKELFALADELGYDFAELGGKTEVKATIDALADDDPDLTSFLREAAIMQIYQIYADGDAELYDSLDVSALIPNYFLYTEAEAGRDMEKNSSGNWRIKGGENTTIFPGWTMNRSAGNWVPTTVKVGAGDGYMDWERDGHVFVAGLRCKNNTRGTLSTVVTGLPEGYYSVGLYGYNQTTNVKFAIQTDSVTIGDDNNASLNIMNGGKSSSKFNYKEVGSDSVLVAGNLSLTINQTSDSGSEFDIRYFILRLRGINPDADYEALLEAQQELLTLVDANKAVKEGVEYYTVGGMKLDAPKSGQILIRRTTQNGKVVVDKVLIK
jgi:hypothetical protein